MKQFLLLLCAAVLGGLIAGYFTLQSQKFRAVVAPDSLPPPIRLVNQPASAGGTNSSEPAADFKAAAKMVTPSVVHIAARVTEDGKDAIKMLFDRQDSPQRGGGEGSGVIYTSNGYVITNYHVIEATNEITVTTNRNQTYGATIVGFDEKTDIAVLKVEADELPYLEMADSDDAEIGEWVMAAGNPLSLNSTVTAGIISAKGRSLQLLRDRDAIESFIQTDAAVNPGNSGGPLVDIQGRLLGINTAIASKTGLFQGYSFAIPINLVRRIADDIIEYGSYQRAFLGVEIYSLTADDAIKLGVQITQGVVVEDLLPGGSAEVAGLQPNDVIIQVNDRVIRELPDLTEIIGRTKIGDEVLLTVFRGDEAKEITVKMLPAE
ncbi:peptidase A2 [Lewinellaceae bacterium SD302]|nr:peptidase A2 [Lewinellaceae bacterium SD302]